MSSKIDSRKMGSYSVILSENAYRDLKKIDRLKLPQQQIFRIFKAVKSLEDDPRPRGRQEARRNVDTALPNKFGPKRVPDRLPD